MCQKDGEKRCRDCSMENRKNKCSKVCWDLLELTEKQSALITKLTLRVKELESVLRAEEVQQ